MFTCMRQAAALGRRIEKSCHFSEPAVFVATVAKQQKNQLTFFVQQTGSASEYPEYQEYLKYILVPEYPKQTHPKIHQACVLSELPYELECWRMTMQDS